MLFIHAPTAIVPSVDIAAAVAPIAKTVARNVLACWLGGDAVAQARDTFAEAGIPTFDTPDKAVRGFLRIVQYQRNQELLMQVPSVSNAVVENRARAQALVRDALAAGRMMLPETESKAVLAAYGIPVVETRTAGTADEAARVAAEIGFPVAVKILSPDIRHKSDVGGVVLDLESAEAVRAAVAAITKRLRELRSSARIQGFAVQAMARKSEGRELIIGVVTDPVFGPVVLFGQGGIAVEVTADHAIALPPLNMVLARELISRTRVSKLLQGYRNRRPADIDAICSALIQVCHLIIDIPEIVEMDINPLLADAKGVVALDARINITRTDKRGIDRLAIRPYPAELEEWVDWQGERILIRPVKPEDAPQHVAFFNSLDPEDVRYRIFTRMRELQHSQLARLTQIDYDREMAFIATRVHENGESETLGVARAIADPDNNKAEFAIIVRSDLKGKGLGRILFRKLIDYCRSHGMQQIIGETLNYNKALIRLVREFGFEVKPSPDGDTMLLTLDLRARQTSATQK
jgi:acetyltransferase